MNIEQKNTLFVVSLVLVVLVSVASMSYVLIRQHVNHQIRKDLERAHNVLVEAQEQRFRTLAAEATHYRSEPALVSSLLTGHRLTIEGMLEDLADRAEVDVIALYPAGKAADGVGESKSPYLSSPRVLRSEAFREVVGTALREDRVEPGHALVFNTLLRLVAVPVENPVGGQLGVLLLGQEVGDAEIGRLQELVTAEVALYSGDTVLAATVPAFNAALSGLPRDSDGTFEFSASNEQYYGHAYPILGYEHGSVQASVLLAMPSRDQWLAYQVLSRNALYFALLILLTAALLGIWISRSWPTKPLKRLARVTTAIGRGDLDVRVEENRSDEIGELARSFNRMLQRLKASQAEEALSRQRFHDFAESTSDWLWETNEHGEFTYVSQNIEGTLAVEARSLIGSSFEQAFPHDNLQEIMLLLRPPKNSISPIKDQEIWITTREGIRLCLRLNGMPFFDGEHWRGFRGTARDITKVKNDEERLINLANKDHLTGLSNRRRFMEDLAREITVSQRQGLSGALLLIDLDQFKLVNDTAGHAAGDEVVVQVGGLLRRTARNIDLVARLSGDEFVIALVNTNAEQAARRAEELLKSINQLRPIYAGKILNTSASIGIVIFPNDGATTAELLAKADTAMYAAKRAGRNRVHLYDETDMDQERMGSQLEWKERIHAALEQDLFELAFQPIVATSGPAVHRYEVLVRLRASDGSLYSPGSFIPTAEQFGLIKQVDSVIVRKAIRTMGELPIDDHPACFSINLSGLSVGDDAILELIEQELDEAAVDRSRIVFEITESAACEDIGRAGGFIERIRELGCRAALDDFGVGFSSFAYLKHLKTDIIKIDGSFIRDIHNSREDQLFVKALVDVARGMGMQTVAEFVESEQALSMVRTLGVDYAQGYYIGMPGPELIPGGRKPPQQGKLAQDSGI